MAAFSRGLTKVPARAAILCSRCQQLSTTAAIQSGHNRWSKIKHDKGAADAKKNQQRSTFDHEISLASKRQYLSDNQGNADRTVVYGGDPNTNPKLAAVLGLAKKAGFPKASMEAAIARGQGKSATGAALENVSLEFIMPPTVAMIVETETDNKQRILMDLRHLVKKHGGTVTPTSYLFQKKGRVSFENAERKLDIDDVLEDAIEAGAEDIDLDEDGNIVLYTEPSNATAAAEAFQKSARLKVESSDIIWDPKEDTKVTLDLEAAKKLLEFAEALSENPHVQGVYANVTKGNLSDDIWEDLNFRFDL